jgi:hypothetical protein
MATISSTLEWRVRKVRWNTRDATHALPRVAFNRPAIVWPVRMDNSSVAKARSCEDWSVGEATCDIKSRHLCQRHYSQEGD